MTKTIVNLTLPLITKTIQEVLVTYPYQPYQTTFANPEVRQSLISYALTNISSCYVVVDEDKKQQFMSSNPLRYCTQQTLDTEEVIRQGIRKIMQENPQKVEPQTPESLIDDDIFSPSNWFG
jgi:hypothetical protein